jgi:hypothetical protein
MNSLLRTLALTTLIFLAGCAASLQRPAERGIAFAMMGDTPYNSAEIAQLDALIDQLNREDLAFVVHVGDITSGGGPCTDAWMDARKAQFNRIRHPFILIPGDNDWTDCHRSRMDPMERLASFRHRFTTGNQSLGAKTMPVERQGGRFAEFSEHMRWEAGRLLFVTLNVQGSNNNLGRNAAMDAEYRHRLDAVLAWIADAERLVRERNLEGLVLMSQANPDFEETWLAKSGRKGPDGFAEFREALRGLAARLGKPILFVHGDTHTYQLDRPLKDKTTGKVFDHFVRVEVWGSPWVRWVRGSIHPGAALPFYVEQTAP